MPILNGRHLMEIGGHGGLASLLPTLMAMTSLGVKRRATNRYRLASSTDHTILPPMRSVGPSIAEISTTAIAAASIVIRTVIAIVTARVIATAIVAMPEMEAFYGNCS